MVPVSLNELDGLKVTTLIDNYSDVLMPESPLVTRFRPFSGEEITECMLAEHGLSLLLKGSSGGRSQTVLLDGGWSENATLYNMKQMNMDPKEISALILSHGHMDHFGALSSIISTAQKKLPLICHPGAFQKGRVTLVPGGKARFPELKEETLASAGAEVIKTKDPYVVEGGFFAVTGEIPREFEKGSPVFFIEVDGNLEWDPITDDQAVLAIVKNKGLVVISGCAHAGILNTIHYARKITGIEKVYAIIGGFHLSALTSDILNPILERLRSFEPEVIVPMHCTGWEAISRIAAEMPKSFILNSVGSTINL